MLRTADSLTNILNWARAGSALGLQYQLNLEEKKEKKEKEGGGGVKKKGGGRKAAI